MKKILLYFLMLAALVVIMKFLDYSGLLLFLYILIMPAGIIAVAVLTYYFWRKEKAFIKIPLSMLAPSLATYLVYYDLTAEENRFEEYCESNGAGRHVYKTVNGVSGFYDPVSKTGCDNVCRDGLLHYGYDFVEAELQLEAYEERISSWSRSGMRTRSQKEALAYRGFATEPGFYRFYVIDTEDDPRCELSNKWLKLNYTKRYENGLGRREDYQGLCVATEKIEEPAARYAVLSERKELDADGRLNMHHRQVIDRVSGDVLAESKSFGFTPRTFFAAHLMFMKRGCPNPREYLDYDEVIIKEKTSG